jgi:hypothetical protein
VSRSFVNKYLLVNSEFHLLLLKRRPASLYDVNANENHCECPKTLAQVILLTVADLLEQEDFLLRVESHF